MSDSLPDDLPEAPDPAELPAAAQWMMAQAAAADTATERAESELHFTPLPERVAPGFPRFCFLNGERDEAAANNRNAAHRLERLGAATRLRIYPGLGHEFPPEDSRDRELDLALRFAFGF